LKARAKRSWRTSRQLNVHYAKYFRSWSPRSRLGLVRLESTDWATDSAPLANKAPPVDDSGTPEARSPDFFYGVGVQELALRAQDE